MVARLDPPLSGRDGRRMRVLLICRISTESQDVKSLADQEASYRRWIDEHSDAPYEVTVIAGRGSGENLDRADYLRAVEHVESGDFDLVLTEDLGRICRRVQAHLFCEAAEDSGTRLIAINDHVDTFHDDWRLNSFFAVMRHESYNRDTGKRIRRTLRNRFSQGGVFQVAIFGYIKPPGTKSEADVTKDPAAVAVYDEWFRRLENGASYSEVADWLNEIGKSVGPGSRRSKSWTGRMVRRVTFNPILKGERRRNERMSKRVNKTGRRKSIVAPPEERLSRQCAHLAFIEPNRYDRVIRRLVLRNAGFARGRKAAADIRKGVPRKRTVWPGQHVNCGVCGRPFYWGGHGQNEHLMCSGARDYRCWNAATFDGLTAANRIGEAIFSEIETLPDWDPLLQGEVRSRMEAESSAVGEQLDALAKRINSLSHEIARVTDAIAQIGFSPALGDKLRNLESDRDRLSGERVDLEQRPKVAVDLPPMAEIKRLARESLGDMATDSPEFGRLMARLIPNLEVRPYRLIDGGAIVLRAHLTLHLASLADFPVGSPASDGILRRTLVVDLFDPPQRVEFRERVVALRAAGHSEREVARQLALTVTAAQRAAALDRMMRIESLDDPYRPVTEAPIDCTKFRRHRHPRYKFEPLNVQQQP